MTSTALNRISASIVHFPALFGRFLPSLSDRTDLVSLSREQLVDAGIDPAEVFTGPVLHVDAPLMTTLMSMR